MILSGLILGMIWGNNLLAALLYGREDLRLERVMDPTPASGEVVIKVGSATTCGTDLKVWRRGGHTKMLTLPTLFGHEAAGTIVALGRDVTGWKMGNRVIANNSAPCMKCFYCQRQEYSLCPHLTWNNGSFAEYWRIPSAIVQHNMISIPEELPDDLAAMTEPLACVLHGVARSGLKSHDECKGIVQKVVVMGDGAIGLMFVAKLAHDFPVEVILFGGDNNRLMIGKKLGATHIFNYHQTPDIAGIVKELTDGLGADIVIEATGVPSVWETAITTVRPGGTVNLFGGCPQDTSILVSTEKLHYNELTLKGVFHNTPYFVREALNLIATRRIPFHLLLSTKFDLKKLETAFCHMQEHKVIKAVIVP
jgi:L-iditol 2-dehydrogenase